MDAPTPTPILPPTLRLAFERWYRPALIIILLDSLKLPLVTIDEHGLTAPLSTGATFVSRRPDVVSVDSSGTIVARAMGNAWIVASAGLLGSDSTEVLVRCTLELGGDLVPSAPTIRVGESFVPTIQRWTCRRRVLIDESFTWRTPNPDIVDVDSLTGRTMGRAPGVAAVYPVGRRYQTLGPIIVTVLAAQ